MDGGAKLCWNWDLAECGGNKFVDIGLNIVMNIGQGKRRVQY